MILTFMRHLPIDAGSEQCIGQTNVELSPDGWTALLPLEKEACRLSPDKFDSNSLIWMLTVNGMMVDVRHLPIEVQEVAYQKGLIPYVPGVKHS